MTPPRIHLLPDTLANQIAAGEVVERPASVVKELVENALDAQATRVEIDLLDGGKRLVRVRDDGVGMGRMDAELCLRRHATSKLRSKEDLFAIGTYGFRGEALPSIAAVSRFSLLTCEPGALSGTRVEVDGGQLGSIGDAGAPQGTMIEVRDLFWNVPARRKFLKRGATEQSYVLETVLKLAVPRREAGFVVREDERVLLRLAPGETLEQRAAGALGPEVRGQLLPFDATVRGVRAHGLGASPEIAHGNARNLWLFVNGRAVRDRQLMHAVLRAYGEVLPHGRYPAALVFLEVPPSEVDVNVHPAKAEVRLADGRAAYEAIARGLAAVLAPGGWLHRTGSAQVPAARGYTLAPTGEVGSREELVRIPAEDAQALRVSEALERYGQRAPWGQEPRDWSRQGQVAHPQAQLLAPLPYFRGLRYLGQLQRTYLVCEGPRGLVLIDQHAAHERMNYQRLRRAADERGAPVQPLLVPRVLRLGAQTVALVQEARPALQAGGFELEDFGDGTLAVKALPALLSQLSDDRLSGLLADLAHELETQGRGESLEKLRDALLARAGCHASIRAHDALEPGEAQALLDALDGTDYGARCAHGRPVVAEWSTVEIEKRFGRDYESFGHAPAPETM
ncbi:MAG: DNA mismatch repair endonuclease MutL [Deltaproteobacteria bacterium]|nr:DNA mismatch repair endonuclease MutL [Deltaproteobacteria bacterium]